MKISDQIRTRREALDLTIVELARQLDVSDQAVRYWENGRNPPSRKMMPAIEKALGITLDPREMHADPAFPTAASGLSKDVLDLALKIQQLPVGPRRAITALVGAYPGSAAAASA